MSEYIRYRRDLHKLLWTYGDAVEIGVAEGLFSRDILNMPKIQKLYMVDRWACCPGQRGDASLPQEWHDENLIQVRQRVGAFGDRGVILKGDSVNMADLVPDNSLVLVYIDADHSYEGVKQDIHHWISKAVEGGVMAFHDYLNPSYGVKAAVDEFCQDHFLEVHELPEDKSEDAGAWFRVVR